MKPYLRLVPLLLTIMLAVGLVLPAAGQDMELMSYSADDCDYGGTMKSIEAVDELTVKFTLCAPDPAFPLKAAFAAILGIQPSEYLEATGGTGDLLNNPIGTGPYKLERWDLGNEVILTGFSDYWGDAPKEQTAIFRWNSEAAARLIELQAGTVDGIDNPNPGDFGVIEADPNLVLYERQAANIMYLGISNFHPPLDNVLVRRAIAHAIDKQRVVDNFYPPGSSAATQFMPPIVFGHTAEVTGIPYDPAEAERLLDEAGLPRDADGIRFSTTLSYRDVVRGYLPTPGIVAQDLQAQLAQVGIQVEVQVIESGAFIDAALAGELPLHLLGWTADYVDATNFLNSHFGEANAQFGNAYPEIYEPMNEGGRLSDPEARLEWYRQANQMIQEFVPVVPIAHGGNGAAYQTRIIGSHAQLVGQEKLKVMEDPNDDNIIFMQNAEPITLYCPDVTDGETFRVCEQIVEGLLAYQVGSGELIPSLAVSYEANEDATEWVFKLREGVRFHDGSTLDANDVVLSYVMQWDYTHPLHVGRDGSFPYWMLLANLRRIDFAKKRGILEASRIPQPGGRECH